MFNIPPLSITLSLMALSATSAMATNVAFTSATFTNLVETQNDADAYSTTSDITIGGLVVGQLLSSITHQGGNAPFTESLFRTGAEFNATGTGPNGVSGFDTAIGDWSFEIIPIAGWQVDGLSISTRSAVSANPIFSNIVTDGVATLTELDSDLITDADDGDIISNGSDLTFKIGTNINGIDGVEHAGQFEINAEGASSLSFTYFAGTQLNGEVNLIGNESVIFDAQLSAIPVPEPSSTLLLGLGGLALLARRRR